MSTKEASRAASAAFHAKRKAAGWRKVTVWLSPEAVERLDELKAAHGSADEAVRQLLCAPGAPRSSKPEASAKRARPVEAAPPSSKVSLNLPLAGTFERKPYQKTPKR